MKREQIVDEIKLLTDKIQENTALVISHQNNIPQIEIDLLLNNVRNLYDALLLLNKFNNEFQIPSNPEPTPDIHNSTNDLLARVEQQEKNEMENENNVESENSEPTESHAQPESIIAAVESPVHEIEEVTTEQEVIQKGNIELKTDKENTRQQNAAPATLFDIAPSTVGNKYSGSPSVYDKISTTKEDKSLATRLQKNPVSDLKKSIGINEKFSFINELFDGDLNSYNEAIDKLNSSNSHDEAITLLNKNLTDKFGWATEGESLQKLKTLIDRRFSA